MLTEREVGALLDRLCLDLGFCLSPAEVERLANDPPLDPASFADEVFRAEGLDPETEDRHLYRQVRERVALAFSQSEEREQQRRVAAREGGDSDQ